MDLFFILHHDYLKEKMGMRWRWWERNTEEGGGQGGEEREMEEVFTA